VQGKLSALLFTEVFEKKKVSTKKGKDAKRRKKKKSRAEIYRQSGSWVVNGMLTKI